MKNYIINDLDDNTMNSSRKARNDVFIFAKQAGFKEILLPFIIHPQDRSFKAKLQKLKYSKITIPKLLKNANDADVIVFQYPMYSTFLMNHLIEAPTLSWFTSSTILKEFECSMILTTTRTTNYGF